jgi:hypothetical protein
MQSRAHRAIGEPAAGQRTCVWLSRLSVAIRDVECRTPAWRILTRSCTSFDAIERGSNRKDPTPPARALTTASPRATRRSGELQIRLSTSLYVFSRRSSIAILRPRHDPLSLT